MMSINTQKPKIEKLQEPKVMRPKKTEKVKPEHYKQKWYWDNSTSP